MSEKETIESISTIECVPILKLLNGYGQGGLRKGVRGFAVGELLRRYVSLYDLLPDAPTPCIAEPLSIERRPLRHEELKEFVTNRFNLTEFGIPTGCRVALLLPNGPELAVAIIALLTRWCAVPINATYTSEEIRIELESTKSQAIIILAGASANEAALEAARALDIGVIVASPAGSISGLFHLALLHKVPESAASCGYSVARTVDGFQAFDHPETVLLLHTSGTSGNKKLVPYSLDMIVTGVGCIVASWDLRPSDVCLNMMPLFHIGGIMRNILSPILSGGCVITCSGFDPLLFWDILTVSVPGGELQQVSPSHAASSTSPTSSSSFVAVDDTGSEKWKKGNRRNDYEYGNGIDTPLRPTWYYAAPTMHHAILMEAERRPKPLPVDSVRYIANAAGGLLPVLADALKTTFKNAVILTSYGMTECMPISTPPQSYALDPTGTSGMQVGPDIVITDDDMKPVPNGVKGNIMVRGPPCFGGYENNFAANDESFFEINGLKGWFNTGDMGSLDDEGYLFISGRSKEIINRGGETISPFEIEEAIQQHPSVKETLAFSAPHEQYQETVGCVIVTRPDFQRVDLPTLHQFLEDKLHRSKWPYVIVYSDGLPKNAANKILRIRYAERAGLKAINEETPLMSRLYEAPCPPPGTPLTCPISISALVVDYEETKKFLISQPSVRSAAVVVVDLPFKPTSLVAFIVLTEGPTNLWESGDTRSAEAYFHELCRKALHAYQAPECVYVLPSLPKKLSVVEDVAAVHRGVTSIDISALSALAQRLYSERTVTKPRNATEAQMELVWRQELGSASAVSVTASFFDLGGDSLKAGQLINAIRKRMNVHLAVTDLFTAPTIELLSHRVSMMQTLGVPSRDANDVRSKAVDKNGWSIYTDEYIPPPINTARASSFDEEVGVGFRDDDQSDSEPEYSNEKTTSPFASDSFSCLFVQALPLVLILPLRRVLVWLLVAALWVQTMRWGQSRLHALMIAIVLSRAITSVVAPLVGVAAKWLIIGRYKPGRYPLWGNMYLRWWIVEQIINIMGTGIFHENQVPFVGSQLTRFYYTLLGASIGCNLKIHKDTQLGQADLLTIGDDVNIDAATVRCFAVEAGHFVLLPITIGDRCCIGIKNSIAPGAQLPADTCLGPLSSSYELPTGTMASNKQYCRPTFPSAPGYLTILVGGPILLSVFIIELLPWLFGLHLMVNAAKKGGWYDGEINSIYDAFTWWTEPERLLYYFILRLIRRCFMPFIQLALVIIIKRLVIGKFTPMNAEEKAQPWNQFRYWLMSKLMSGSHLCGVAQLVGTHYEVISIIFRLLGSKIGKRVYWPGSGLDIVEYDLLEVGDDVVFGSRSVILTSSATRSAPVVFEAGSMVADRCVILPGVRLGRGAVLGSGSLAPEDMCAPVGSVWVGSTEGSAVNMGPADLSYNVKDTIRPFGRAFYNREAPFTVLPLSVVVTYSAVWQAFCTLYRSISLPLSLIVATAFLTGTKAKHTYYSPFGVFEMTYSFYVPLHLAFCLFAVLFDISSKWILMRRRKPGLYPWDQSSYCQRWQIYLTLEEIRRGERRKTGVLDMIAGSQYLVWYFRALGCRIGRDVCLYPNGGDPMMTEPDLVTIGDGASIDDASLIAHINTRGIFRLNPLVVGNGAVLRSGTRLLSGASMDAHSVVLEHTLVLSGECVDSGAVWQGWPSRAHASLSQHRKATNKAISHAIRTHRSRLRSFKRNNNSSYQRCCMYCNTCISFTTDSCAWCLSCCRLSSSRRYDARGSLRYSTVPLLENNSETTVIGGSTTHPDSSANQVMSV